jgi:polar amino acid transport system substrate-binding protein
MRLNNQWMLKVGRRAGFTAALALVLTMAAAAAPVRAGGANAPPTPSTSAAPDASGEAAARRVVIRFLTEGDFPPFNYLDDDGVLTGFNVDLARTICQELGAACDIKVRPWDELILGLRRGDADAVIAAHSVTEAGLSEVEFTDRYFHTPGRFAARTDGAKSDIDPDSLDGRTIGVARGSPHKAYLRAFFRESRIQPFESSDLAREALQQGKVELIFDDGIGLSFWINGTLSRQCCELRGGAYFEPKYFGDGLAIAVPRNDPQIRLMINGALQKVRKSGRFDELISRYFPHRVY